MRPIVSVGSPVSGLRSPKPFAAAVIAALIDQPTTLREFAGLLHHQVHQHEHQHHHDEQYRAGRWRRGSSCPRPSTGRRPAPRPSWEPFSRVVLASRARSRIQRPQAWVSTAEFVPTDPPSAWLGPVACSLPLFWALLWGPIGLLLATPLTVCLVVLGRHIEALEFIEVLLGDEPALEPEERFYQRLLAGDATEAADQAEKQLKEQSLSAYYDSVPMKALALAQADAAHGKLSADKQLAIRDTMAEIVDDLADHADEPPEPKEGEPASPRIPILSSEQLRPEWQVDYPVLCIASRSPLDEAAATMLAQLLEKHGLPAKIQPFADVASAKSLRIDARDAPLVCLSYFGAVRNPAHVRFLIRRLKRMMPNAKFLACFWMLAEDPEKGGRVEDGRGGPPRGDVPHRCRSHLRSRGSHTEPAAGCGHIIGG